LLPIVVTVGVGFGSVEPAAALHLVAGCDLGLDAEGAVEFVDPHAVAPATSSAPTTTTSANSPTRPTTAPQPGQGRVVTQATTGSAVSAPTSATSSTSSGAQLDKSGLILRGDGQWVLPTVTVPTADGTILEDLLWFRFDGDRFGRSQKWSGRVEVVAFDGGGPRVAVRCSSTRRDGAVAYHDGHEWRQTGVLLRGGVDYLIRTVFKTTEGRADIYLIEPSRESPTRGPIVGAPLTTQATTVPSTRSAGGTSQPSTDRSTTRSVTTPPRAYAVRPQLTTGRQVRIVAGALCPGFEGATVRRAVRIDGGVEFSTTVKRWQLWDVTTTGRDVVGREERRTVATLPIANAAELAGPLQLCRLESGRQVVRFRRQVGLQDDLRSTAGWMGEPNDRIVDEQGGPALVARGLGSLGHSVSKAFMPPRVPFDLRIVFKLPPDTPPMRTIDLVRLIRKDTRTTIGPYVQLHAGMHDLGKGRWGARLAAQVGGPQPVVDSNPIELDTWYELALAVNPVGGVYTATLTALGKDRPAKLYVPTTCPASMPAAAAPGTSSGGKPGAKPAPPARKPDPKPVAVFGGKPQKFFGLSRLPNEMALLFEVEGAYRSLGPPIELSVKPSFVLPVNDKARPWTNPATMTDMTYRDGRLEILNTHAGGSLITVGLADGTLTFTEKAFGPHPGQALAWDPSLGCYWWVQPTGRLLLERRWPDRRDISTFSAAATTRPANRFGILPARGPATIDGKLDEWNRGGACGPFTDDVTKVGARDSTFYAMYDATCLYLAAEIHDPDPLKNVAVPAGKAFDTGDLVTFRFCLDPAGGRAGRTGSQPSSTASIVSVHFWHNHQQKKTYSVLTTAPPGTQPAEDAKISGPAGVQVKMTPWPDKDPRGKGYTLEAACPCRSVRRSWAPAPGDVVGFSASVVWGDPGGSKAVGSVTAFGQTRADGVASTEGCAILARQGEFASLDRNEVIGLHGNGRLAVTAKDLFLVTWEKDVYRVGGKTGEPVTFSYRQNFNSSLRFAGVAVDDRTLLLAGPYGAPNAGTILAVDLASGQPIRRLSLRRYVQGITSLAGDGKQLYALAATERMILGCDWPGRRLLGLTCPVLWVGRIDIVPTQAVDRLDLITATGSMPKWGGSVSRQKDAKTGTERFVVKEATLQWPAPTVVVGDTLGQFRKLRVRLLPIGPAQALQIALAPKPVGKARSVYVAALDSKSAAQWPLGDRRTTAKAFFAGPGHVGDAKSPLRQFKPASEDEPVLVLPAGAQSVEIELDLMKDFGLAADTWVGQLQLRSVGTTCQVEALSVLAAADVRIGPAEGTLVGDVVDLEHAGYELLDWKSDLSPAGREGDELAVWVRSANERTELPYLGWHPVGGGSTDGRTATTQPRTASTRSPVRLGRYVQWRLDLGSIHIHEPPSVSSVRFVLAGGRGLGLAAGPAAVAQPWRKWWPLIFATPVACLLIWFIFVRRGGKRGGSDQEDPVTVQKGRFRKRRRT